MPKPEPAAAPSSAARASPRTPAAASTSRQIAPPAAIANSVQCHTGTCAALPPEGEAESISVLRPTVTATIAVHSLRDSCVSGASVAVAIRIVSGSSAISNGSTRASVLRLNAAACSRKPRIRARMHTRTVLRPKGWEVLILTSPTSTNPDPLLL